MRWSCLYIPTLRDDPAGVATASTRLLLRAGYLRECEPGRFHCMTLLRRSLRRIVALCRRELDAAGAQEVLLAGEGELAGRLASACRGGLRSYRQLPQAWYEFGTRVREEPRSGLGLLGASPQMVVRLCSLVLAGRGDISPQQRAISRVAEGCGLPARWIEAPGGGKHLVVLSEAGELQVAVAGESIAHAELAQAEASLPAAADPPGDLDPEPFPTPGQKTIAQVAAFTGLPETSQMKSVVMAAGDTLVLALVRGDHEVSLAKLARASGADGLRPATEEEIRRSFGAGAGSLGPVDLRGVRILADLALQGRRNMICGANNDDYHLRHVTPGEDFAAVFCDLRRAEAGELAATGQAVEMRTGIEIASLSEAAPADQMRVLGPDGGEITPWLSAGTIYLERLLAAAAELYHDPDGLAWPSAVAPFDVIVTPVNVSDPVPREAAERLYSQCGELGLDALLDDRDERAGVKFKDADLIGVPFRIVTGKKAADGMVEVVDRRRRIKTETALGEAAAQVRRQLDVDRLE